MLLYVTLGHNVESEFFEVSDTAILYSPRKLIEWWNTCSWLQNAVIAVLIWQLGC